MENDEVVLVLDDTKRYFEDLASYHEQRVLDAKRDLAYQENELRKCRQRIEALGRINS